MWLIKFIEELPHRGSKRAEPRPSICTSYQAWPKSHSRSQLGQSSFQLARAWLSGSMKQPAHRHSFITVQDDTRVCFVRIHKVEEAAHPVLRVLQRAVPNFHRDIAVVNAGLHYGIGDPGYR